MCLSFHLFFEIPLSKHTFNPFAPALNYSIQNGVAIAQNWNCISLPAAGFFSGAAAAISARSGASPLGPAAAHRRFSAAVNRRARRASEFLAGSERALSSLASAMAERTVFL